MEARSTSVAHKHSVSGSKYNSARTGSPRMLRPAGGLARGDSSRGSFRNPLLGGRGDSEDRHPSPRAGSPRAAPRAFARPVSPRAAAAEASVRDAQRLAHSGEPTAPPPPPAPPPLSLSTSYFPFSSFHFFFLFRASTELLPAPSSSYNAPLIKCNPLPPPFPSSSCPPLSSPLSTQRSVAVAPRAGRGARPRARGEPRPPEIPHGPRHGRLLRRPRGPRRPRARRPPGPLPLRRGCAPPPSPLLSAPFPPPTTGEALQPNGKAPARSGATIIQFSFFPLIADQLTPLPSSPPRSRVPRTDDAAHP